jgi:hypothetical protein
MPAEGKAMFRRAGRSRWIAGLAPVLLLCAGFFAPAHAFDGASLAFVLTTVAAFSGNGGPNLPDPVGDFCGDQLLAALERLGGRVYKGVDRPSYLAALDDMAKRKLTQVDIVRDFHVYDSTFLNTEKFAHHVASQKLDGRCCLTIADAFLRTVLIVANERPVTSPADLKDQELANYLNIGSFASIGVGYTTPWRDRSKTTKYLLVSSNYLNDGAHARKIGPFKYISLTTSLILAEGFYISYDGVEAADARAAIHTVYFNTMVSCSRANYDAEIGEIKRLVAAGATALPVDVNAFQQARRDYLKRQIAEGSISDEYEDELKLMDTANKAN